MLDSALEPSYNCSKKLLLLPWILKLIVDMENDSTPLNRAARNTQVSYVEYIYIYSFYFKFQMGNLSHFISARIISKLILRITSLNS